MSSPCLLSAVIAEERQRLFQEITASANLPQLLAVLGCEIDRSNNIAGYSINLLDESGENLVCEHIRLPVGHRLMQTTLIKYKFPLNLPVAPNTRRTKPQPTLSNASP